MRVNVKNLSFGYRDHSVLEDISFSINEGDFLCVLGKNGAGKSTLFKLLLGFLKKEKGNIIIEGKELEKYSRKDLAKEIAYIPQYTSSAFSYSVFDTVLMGTTCNLEGLGSPKHREKRIAKEALEKFGIANLSNKSTASISGGERQLVLLARAIAQGSHILILDEPTANLDYGNQYKVMSIISKLKDQGYSIILSTHNPEHALTFSDKVLFLDDKKILANGDTDKVMTSENLRKIYDLPIEIINVNGKKICSPISDIVSKIYV
ncbi:MAG: ABC transporter ATP-binding protein [Spirochaetaceae bacterium]|nr:ABC transporter ATP-binding protein [Spirochaetaceae bacterium]